MLVKIEFDSDIPIYEQLRRQIIIGIAKGELMPDEVLPSVRQLSGDIGINMHTVNKSYNILKEEGYLTIDRRKGAVIRRDIIEAKEDYLIKIDNELRYLAADCKNKGISKEVFISMCANIYEEFKNEN